MQNRRILITGATGFIGRFLIKHFLKSGSKVYGISRHPQTLGKNKFFQWIHSDLSIYIPDLPDIDICIHAAGLSPSSEKTMCDFIQNNIQSTCNLIKALKPNNCKKIIYLSGISVFGTVSVPIINEQTPICTPGAYGLSKYVAERVIQEQNDIPSCILRLPGVLGQGSSTPWLIRQIRKSTHNKTITIYNPESMFNNAVWIVDLINFIHTICNQKESSNQLFVLGASNSLSIIDMMNLILKRVRSKSKIEISKGSNSFIIDHSLALKAGYAASNLEEMIFNQIDYELS